MSTIQAERIAVEGLRKYLLRALPAKVDAINATRAATLLAPRAGPYTIPASGSLPLGATKGGETTVALIAGERDAETLADELSGTVPGLTFGADAQGRFYATATQLPGGANKSVVSLGADATGAARALGFDPGGELVVRSPLVAPFGRGVLDGEASGVTDFGQGFPIVIGQRASEPRSANLREDIHRVTMAVDVLSVEPDQAVGRMNEFNESCARAVREVLIEDPTLDGAVFLTELPRVTFAARQFRFANEGGGYSPYVMSAAMTVRVHVFERA